MENHYRELLRFLSARLGDRHAAADVAHDAYLRVLERSSQAQIEHPKAFSVPDGAQPGGGRAPSQPGAPGGTPGGLDDEEGLASPSPQTVVDQGQRLDNLQRALAELPAICRSSFLLRKLDGLSHSQIAEHLNISRSLVEKHIVNAMKHCRVRMREWEAD